MRIERIAAVSICAVLAMWVLIAAVGCGVGGGQTSTAPPSPVVPTAPPDGEGFRGRGFILAVLAMDLDTMTSALKSAVDAGTITQQQASEAWEWWRQKPDFLTGTLFSRNLTGVPRTDFPLPSGTARPTSFPRPTGTPPPNFTGVPRRPGGFGLGALAASVETLNEGLIQAVSEGTMTQEQANRTRDWWELKPGFLNQSLFAEGTAATMPPPTSQTP